MGFLTGLPGTSQSNAPVLQGQVRIESTPRQVQQAQPIQYQPVQFKPTQPIQPMQYQPPMQQGGGYAGVGSTQGSSLFGLGGGSTQGSSLFSLGGGSFVTPQNYLGDWVPEPRRKLLAEIGFGNGAGSELLALHQQYNNETNNYAKQAIMSKIVNAEARFNKELQGYDQEYRGLASAANYAGAQNMVNAETAAGRPTSLAAMAGNAILSNNHISHGIIAQGRLQAPAGNAVEDALAAGRLTGRMPSQALLQALAVSDALAQDSYMPGGPFGIAQGIASGYKSMSDVGQAGGMKVYGYDDAYGGSGRQAAVQDSFDILRDHAWQTQANQRYADSINNRMPVGDRKGTGSGVVNTGVSGRVIGYSPSGSSGPAQNTGYGPGGSESSKMPGAPWVDTEGDNWKWTKDGWEQTGKPESIDPVNDGFVRDLRFRGQVDSQANQMRSNGVPEYQVQEFIKRMNKPNGMLQLPPLSAYPAAMGIAEAPPMQRGSMSPSNDVFADQFTPAPSRGDAYTWPYGMRTQSNSFDRYTFNPMLAGAVDARMNNKK